MELQNLADLLKQAKRVDYKELSDEELQNKLQESYFAEAPDYAGGISDRAEAIPGKIG